MRGINASIVGLLEAALYHPVWIGAVTTPPDIALLVEGFLALTFWGCPEPSDAPVMWQLFLGGANCANPVTELLPQ